MSPPSVSLQHQCPGAMIEELSGPKPLEQPLTSEQVDQFFKEGFLVIEKPQIPEAELEWCRDILMRMIVGGERRSEGRNLDLTATATATATDGAGDGRRRRHDVAQLAAAFAVRDRAAQAFIPKNGARHRPPIIGSHRRICRRPCDIQTEPSWASHSLAPRRSIS